MRCFCFAHVPQQLSVCGAMGARLGSFLVKSCSLGGQPVRTDSARSTRCAWPLLPLPVQGLTEILQGGALIIGLADEKLSLVLVYFLGSDEGGQKGRMGASLE